MAQCLFPPHWQTSHLFRLCFFLSPATLSQSFLSGRKGWWRGWWSGQVEEWVKSPQPLTAPGIPSGDTAQGDKVGELDLPPSVLEQLTLTSLWQHSVHPLGLSPVLCWEVEGSSPCWPPPSVWNLTSVALTVFQRRAPIPPLREVTLASPGFSSKRKGEVRPPGGLPHLIL